MARRSVDYPELLVDTLLGNLFLLTVDVAAVRVARRGWYGVVGAAALGVLGSFVYVWISRHFTWTSTFLLLQLWCWWGFLHLPAVLLIAGWPSRGRWPAVAFAGLTTSFAAEAFFLEPRSLEVTTTHLPGPPLRVALVADVQTDHVGAYEADVFARIAAAEPDLVLFAGDYVQVYDRQVVYPAELDRLHALVATLDPPLGGYAVQGDVDRREWVRAFEGTRITPVPETSTFTVGPLTVTALSIEDSRRHDLDLPRVAGTHLVFGHAPDFVLGSGRRDLNLAGHTHGGQVRIPGFGPVMTLTKVPRAAAGGGPTRLDDGSWLYVSRGVGMERKQAPRLRFNCPPEVAILELGVAAPAGG